MPDGRLWVLPLTGIRPVSQVVARPGAGPRGWADATTGEPTVGRGPDQVLGPVGDPAVDAVAAALDRLDVLDVDTRPPSEVVLAVAAAHHVVDVLRIRSVVVDRDDGHGKVNDPVRFVADAGCWPEELDGTTVELPNGTVVLDTAATIDAARRIVQASPATLDVALAHDVTSGMVTAPAVIGCIRRWADTTTART